SHGPRCHPNVKPGAIYREREGFGMNILEFGSTGSVKTKAINRSHDVLFRKLKAIEPFDPDNPAAIDWNARLRVFLQKRNAITFFTQQSRDHRTGRAGANDGYVKHICCGLLQPSICFLWLPSALGS